MNVKKEYARDLYSATQTVTEPLLDESVDIEEELSTEFGIDFYPLEAGVEPRVHQYFRTSHALSYLLADKYSSMDDSLDYTDIDFFDRRKEDFEGFESEFTGSVTNNVSLSQRHLIQYANLYSKVCQEEGIEPSYTGIMFPSPRVDVFEQQDAVLEILEDLDEGLGDEAVSSLE
ncbi:hypothetical protein GLU64_00090 [Nanohaloarchaea archaeon]|nr:hypothetical protein [Candidatus Nanohaloarchaea archaeon]